MGSLIKNIPDVTTEEIEGVVVFHHKGGSAFRCDDRTWRFSKKFLSHNDRTETLRAFVLSVKDQVNFANRKLNA